MNETLKQHVTFNNWFDNNKFTLPTYHIEHIQKAWNAGYKQAEEDMKPLKESFKKMFHALVVIKTQYHNPSHMIKLIDEALFDKNY